MKLAEDARALLAEADVVLTGLQTLIRRINRTNSAASMGKDGTITDALARRDVLRLRHAVVTNAAAAAAGRNQGGIARQLRSELKILTALRSAGCAHRPTTSRGRSGSWTSGSSAPTGKSTCWTEPTSLGVEQVVQIHDDEGG